MFGARTQRMTLSSSNPPSPRTAPVHPQDVQVINRNMPPQPIFGHNPNPNPNLPPSNDTSTPDFSIPDIPNSFSPPSPSTPISHSKKPRKRISFDFLSTKSFPLFPSPPKRLKPPKPDDYKYTHTQTHGPAHNFYELDHQTHQTHQPHHPQQTHAPNQSHAAPRYHYPLNPRPRPRPLLQRLLHYPTRLLRHHELRLYQLFTFLPILFAAFWLLLVPSHLKCSHPRARGMVVSCVSITLCFWFPVVSDAVFGVQRVEVRRYDARRDFATWLFAFGVGTAVGTGFEVSCPPGGGNSGKIPQGGALDW